MAGALDHRIGETLLGKYLVRSVLGRGGMGVVYEAEDTRLGRHVAIKVLNAAARSQKGADKRFHLEARAIAALMHPHLVTLLDYDFLEDGTPCIVMERVEGMSLKATMARRTFTPLEVTLVLYQTLLALSACHAKGVIHRDLKPENLLLTRGGQQGITVKVIDFGLTKLLADSGAGSLTVNGQVFGSPRFMAPEQWLQKEVTGRTDIYALGLIGYCLLRGEHFITVKNPFEICRAHISQPRPALRATPDGTRIPTLLEHVLKRAAEPDPKNRYENADAMIHALEPLTVDALNFTRFTGENLVASHPPSDDASPSPFNAADMAASIDASIAAGEMRSLELTQPGMENVARHANLRLESLDADEDAQTVAEPTAQPVADPLATVMLQPALDLSDRLPSPPPTEEQNRVKFAVRGGVFTAITRGDVERAMNDAAQAADEEAPLGASVLVANPTPPPSRASAENRVVVVRPPSAPVPVVRPRSVTERTSPSLQRQTTLPPARPGARRSSMALIVLGVAVAASLGAAVAWFWM